MSSCSQAARSAVAGGERQERVAIEADGLFYHTKECVVEQRVGFERAHAARHAAQVAADDRDTELRSRSDSALRRAAGGFFLRFVDALLAEAVTHAHRSEMREQNRKGRR
jgi:hypothetical protein